MSKTKTKPNHYVNMTLVNDQTSGTDTPRWLPILTCGCHRPADQPQATHYSATLSAAIDHGRSIAHRSLHSVHNVRVLPAAIVPKTLLNVG